MPGLVEVDRDAVMLRIADVCSALPSVAAGFFFGSALGRCRPDSDIDVGIVARDVLGRSAQARFQAALRLEYEAYQRLGEWDGHAFDVTVLDPEQPLFAMTVLSEGRLCHVGDRDSYTDFLEHVAQRYRQDAPRYEHALDEVLEEPMP